MTRPISGLETRFWPFVTKASPNACWLWAGHTNNKGYGLFRPGGLAEKVLAHRMSWCLHHGPIPDGLLVLHRCDTPRCVNPRHLFLGTYKDNAQDMLRKGRNRPVWGGVLPPVHRGDDAWTRRFPERVPKGEDVATSKLTSKDVQAIYRLRLAGTSHRAIARRYNMDKSTIGDICRGERWAHLLGKDGAPTREELLAVPDGVPPTKIKATDIPTIRKLLREGMLQREVAVLYGVNHATISDIARGSTWRDA